MTLNQVIYFSLHWRIRRTLIPPNSRQETASTYEGEVSCFFCTQSGDVSSLLWYIQRRWTLFGSSHYYQVLQRLRGDTRDRKKSVLRMAVVSKYMETESMVAGGGRPLFTCAVLSILVLSCTDFSRERVN